MPFLQYFVILLVRRSKAQPRVDRLVPYTNVGVGGEWAGSGRARVESSEEAAFAWWYKFSGRVLSNARIL